MKLIFLVDEKPDSCDNCPFKTDILDDSNMQDIPEGGKRVDLVDGCYLTNKPLGVMRCPVLEDKNYFDNLDTTKDFVLYDCVEEG